MIWILRAGDIILKLHIFIVNNILSIIIQPSSSWQFTFPPIASFANVTEIAMVHTKSM